MAWGVPKIGATAIVASGNMTGLGEPVSAASGDLMICCIAYRGNAAFTAPGEWSLVATQQSSGDTDATNGIASGGMWWCVRGGSSPSFSFTRTGGDVAIAHCIAYTGGHASAPYDTGSANTLGSASTTVTTGTISTAEAGELIVAMTSAGDTLNASAFDAATNPTTVSSGIDTSTAPTNGTWFQRINTTTGTGADNGIGIADAVRATAGATGTIQATISGSARHVMIAGAFKLASSNPILTAASTSYSFTGNAATLKRGLKLIADATSYAFTGNAATLRKGYKLTADAGSFALTGNAASLRAAYKLTAAATSYAFTGNAVGLAKGARLTADVGSFAFAGNAATLRRTYRLTAAATSYAFTGNTTGLRKGSRLVADAGSYSFTGNATTLQRRITITAASGAFSLTGTANSLRWGHRITADAGAYAFTGNAVTFPRTYKLTAAATSYVFTGNAANLVHGILGNYTLSANAGVFSYTGNNVDLRYNRRLPADPAGFVFDGNAAAFRRGYAMPADTGVYVWTGLDALLGDIPDVPGTVQLRDQINGTVALWMSTNITMADQQYGGVTIMDEEI